MQITLQNEKMVLRQDAPVPSYFTLEILLAKHRELHIETHLAFVGFEKANRADRNKLLKILVHDMHLINSSHPSINYIVITK